MKVLTVFVLGLGLLVAPPARGEEVPALAANEAHWQELGNVEVVYELARVDATSPDSEFRATMLLRRSGDQYYRKLLQLKSIGSRPILDDYLGITSWQHGAKIKEQVVIPGFLDGRWIDDPRYLSRRILRISQPFPLALATPLEVLTPKSLNRSWKPRGQATGVAISTSKYTEVIDGKEVEITGTMFQHDPDLEFTPTQYGTTSGQGWVKGEVRSVLRNEDGGVLTQRGSHSWVVTLRQDTGLVMGYEEYYRGQIEKKAVVHEFGAWQGRIFPKRAEIVIFSRQTQAQTQRATFTVLDVLWDKAFQPEELTIDSTKVGRVIDETGSVSPQQTAVVSSLETEVRRAAEQAAKLERKVEP